MRRIFFSLLLLTDANLFSENFWEVYTEIGAHVENYRYSAPFLFYNTFQDIKWKAAALDSCIGLKVAPQEGRLAHMVFQIEGGGILYGKGYDFKGNIQENAFSVFTNEKSHNSKIYGEYFETSLGYEYLVCSAFSITAKAGYLLQNRRFHNSRSIFTSPEDSLNYTIENFRDNKLYQDGWIGIQSKYYFMPCMLMKADLEYHCGYVKGDTKWNSEQSSTDGFSALAAGKVNTKKSVYEGLKVKLGWEYDLWEGCIIGLNGYYQYYISKHSNDSLQISQTLINNSGTIIGQSSNSSPLTGKIDWQMYSVSATFGIYF